MQGLVTIGEMAVSGAVVVVSDEGMPIGGALTDAQGAFTIAGLPESGNVTVRALHPDYGAAQTVVALGGTEAIPLVLSVAGCFGYFDLPDPHLLVTPAFLESWEVAPLERRCPDCIVYRWFWERDGLAPVVLRVDFGQGQILSTVRVPDGPQGWKETTVPIKPKRAARLDQAIAHAGYWQLEHHDTSGACAEGDPGSEWTIEALATPGYRAVYRWSPLGTPIALLGRGWLKAAGLKVKRKDFR